MSMRPLKATKAAGETSAQSIITEQAASFVSGGAEDEVRAGPGFRKSGGDFGVVGHARRRAGRSVGRSFGSVAVRARPAAGRQRQALPGHSEGRLR